MNWIDFLIFIILIINILSGLKNGFFEEVGAFAGLIAGIIAGITLKNVAIDYLLEHTMISPVWINLWGFLLPFLLVFLLFIIFAKVASQFFKVISMSWLNRIAGSVFCLFKGLLILSVVLNLYEMVDRDRSLVGDDKIQESLLYEPVSEVAPAIFPALKNMYLNGEKRLHDKESKTINL